MQCCLEDVNTSKHKTKNLDEVSKNTTRKSLKNVNSFLIVTLSLSSPSSFFTAILYYRRRKSIRLRRMNCLHYKTLRILELSYTKYPPSIFGFKISEDLTKPGLFYFGFTHLHVNGKKNPVPTFFGFVTNTEKSPLV